MYKRQCLYFTFALPYTEDSTALAKYYDAKNAVQQTFADLGSPVSHHHGVGTEHRPWMVEDIGEVGARVVRGLFADNDPGRNLNPGKVLEP